MHLHSKLHLCMCVNHTRPLDLYIFKSVMCILKEIKSIYANEIVKSSSPKKYVQIPFMNFVIFIQIIFIYSLNYIDVLWSSFFISIQFVYSFQFLAFFPHTIVDIHIQIHTLWNLCRIDLLQLLITTIYQVKTRIQSGKKLMDFFRSWWKRFFAQYVIYWQQ